jgi:hypothetical protein
MHPCGCAQDIFPHSSRDCGYKPPVDQPSNPAKSFQLSPDTPILASSNLQFVFSPVDVIAGIAMADFI